jgi:hypothetical protein
MAGVGSGGGGEVRASASSSEAWLFALFGLRPTPIDRTT